MEIVWTNFAAQQLKDIFDYYLVTVNRKVANRIRVQLLKSTRQLSKFSNMGQIETHLEDSGLGYRYIISGNYKVIYRIENRRIIINDVFHTRQDPAQMIK